MGVRTGSSRLWGLVIVLVLLGDPCLGQDEEPAEEAPPVQTNTAENFPPPAETKLNYISPYTGLPPDPTRAPGSTEQSKAVAQGMVKEPPLPTGQKLKDLSPPIAPAPDLKKRFCKMTNGLSFCTGRSYLAYLGDGVEAAGVDEKAKAAYDAAVAAQYPQTRGPRCMAAYKAALCAYFFPYCATAQDGYGLCGSICVRFCEACNVCAGWSELSGAKNKKGMTVGALMKKCTLLSRYKVDMNKCTSARACGWLGIPPRMDPSMCPEVFE